MNRANTYCKTLDQLPRDAAVNTPPSSIHNKLFWVLIAA
jgi:hypothetical protein